MKTMKKNLSSQFFICYLLIGIVCFLVVAAGGSFLMERRLERDAGQKIYEEARQIAADDVFSKYSMEDVISKSSLSDSLNYVSYYLDYDIWITDENGTLLFDTSDKGFWTTESYILAFASEITSNHPYAIGTFDDCFSAEQLSVLAPVTDSATTKGYILIHYPLRNIYQNRDIYREVMLVIFFIIYALVFFLFIFYRVYIHTPLQEIVKGATQFENGNFTYRIPVKFDDEMGYLANSLNYMADRLNENGEYQHQVIANVSHDFRSPLTSIKGYVEAILDGTIPPEMQDKYLKIISMESERLEKLTHSLTMLGDFDKRKRLLYMTRFDINKTIRLACATFEGTCDRRDIRLELYLAGTELFVWADKEQIQQVLYNFLDNAIKFSPDHSSIIVDTSEKNGKVFVSVKDHGEGIPKESLSKIWDRFYKQDPSRGKDRTGTGLGLSIVKEIINAHGENLNVISTEGVGSEFIFSLEKAK